MTKSTRKALLSSVVALLLCLTMLIGTTFAWFTDSVTVAGNKIQSGTLKVDLVDEYGTSFKNKELQVITDATEVLWEPGCTYYYTPVYVKNNGNLALKYKVSINLEETVTKVDGTASETIDFLDVIEWGIFSAVPNGAVDFNDAVKLSAFEGHLAAGATSATPLVLVAHMKETAGNIYQNAILEGISITVVATQDTVESDSFDSQYDKDATYPDGSASDSTDDSALIKTADDLIAALNAGGDIKLGADITLDEVELSPDDDSTTISAKLDLNGKTLKANQIEIESGYTLTVLDSATNGKICDNGNSSDLFYVDGGTLNVQGGTIDGSSSRDDAIWLSDGNVTISGGTIIGISGIYQAGGTLTITDGEVGSSGDDGYALYIVNGTANVNGGTFTGCYGIYQYSGTLTITDGEVESFGEDDSYALNIKNGITNISGGTFKGKYSIGKSDFGGVTIISGGTYTGELSVTKGAPIAIAGGTFSVNPSSILDASCEATQNSDGKYVVTRKAGSESEPITVWATVENLNDLKTAISAGVNIKLDEDITFDRGTISIDNDVTIDLCNHTITGNAEYYGTIIVNSGSLKISNGNIVATDFSAAPIGVYGGAAYIEDCTLKGNRFAFDLSSGTATLKNCNFKGGVEVLSGDVTVQSPCTFDYGTTTDSSYKWKGIYISGSSGKVVCDFDPTENVHFGTVTKTGNIWTVTVGNAEF